MLINLCVHFKKTKLRYIAYDDANFAKFCENIKFISFFLRRLVY